MTAHSDIGPYAMMPQWLVRSGVSSGAIHTFAVLALHADRDSGRAYPRRATIAKLCGCSRDTIDRRIAELVAVGAIEVEHRIVDGTYTSNVYHVRYSRPVTDCPPLAAPERQPQPQERGPGGRAGAAIEEPELLQPEPQELELVAAAPPAGIPEPTFDAFWKVYPRRIGKGGARTAFSAAAKKVRPSVIIDAAGRYAEWCKLAETEPQFIPYPSTWLRAERWLDELPAPPRRAGTRAISEDREGPEGVIQL